MIHHTFIDFIIAYIYRLGIRILRILIHVALILDIHLILL